MKKTLLLLTLFLFVVAIKAQDDFSFFNKTLPKVTVKLENFDPVKDGELELKFVSVVPTPERQAEKKMTPNNDGIAEFSPRYPIRYQQIWFSIGDYYYGELIVDKDLRITADLNKLRKKDISFHTDLIKFGGADGALTAYVNQHISYEIPLRKNAPYSKMDIYMDREATADQKAAKLKENFEYNKGIIEKFVAKNPSEHSWVLLNELKSDYYGDLFIMYRNNSMPDELFQEAIKHQPKVCSNNGMSAYHGYINANFFYPSPSEKLSIFQEEVMPSITDPVEKNRLEDFLQVYQDMVEKKEYDKKTFASESKYFNDQYKELVNDASTALFVSKTKQLSPEKADIVLILGGSEDIWERDRYVKNILPEINNDWCANVLKKEWDKTKKHIAMVNKKLEAIEVSTNTNPIGASQGKLSSGGELILAEQENVDNLLASIRAKYPNKAILLDVWATWCGPCIHDMKTSAENIEKLRAMDVEVVYVCVEEGSDAEKWQKKVAELDLNTTHVFLDKKLSGEIMEYFDLRGYPSHLFINKKGKYIRDLVHSISRADLDKVKKKVN